MVEPSAIRVVPANEASWGDLQAVIGERGIGAECQCQRFKLARLESFGSVPVDVRAERLRSQTCVGNPSAPSTTGLVAYRGDEPVGWCGAQPRREYSGLLRVYRTPWLGRSEDKDDPGVWALTCFMVRAGHRRTGVSYALAQAAVDFAQERGAGAIEGYPIIAPPGTLITWGEEFVGFPQVFAAAGFAEVSRPGVRRVVMRREFERRNGTAP
ncbi:MAG: GNAT family N-acetyltransferase [Propionicimonas sp.]